MIYVIERRTRRFDGEVTVTMESGSTDQTKALNECDRLSAIYREAQPRSYDVTFVVREIGEIQ